jgi:hypothetical protein
MTLAEFLLARIAEDEAVYRKFEREWPSPHMDRDTTLTVDDEYAGIWIGPARVLAECDAKRRIVEAYRDERTRRDIYQADDARAVEDDEQVTRRRSSAARTRGLEIAVELLALPYADHDDYDPSWRP